MESTQPKQRNEPMGNWTIRRRFMFIVSAFCVGVISFILVQGIDTSPAETAMTMAFTTLISITMAYVFGATWEDINRLKNGAQNAKL